MNFVNYGESIVFLYKNPYFNYLKVIKVGYGGTYDIY